MLACRHPFVIHKKRRIELSIHPRAVSSLGTGCEKTTLLFFRLPVGVLWIPKISLCIPTFFGFSLPQPRWHQPASQPAAIGFACCMYIWVFFIAFTCASFFVAVAVAVPATFKCKPCSFTGAGYFFFCHVRGNRSFHMATYILWMATYVAAQLIVCPSVCLSVRLVMVVVVFAYMRYCYQHHLSIRKSVRSVCKLGKPLSCW